MIPEYEILVDALREIERQISEMAKIMPGDINDQSIAGYVEKLRNYRLV